mmetsp:Transcript_2989/g.8359  ORF Transcript_2989/g.8359 Transcript_2989/m.8359 type:complete len:250 (+) Transcript_2989:553-1302(+)
MAAGPSRSLRPSMISELSRLRSASQTRSLHCHVPLSDSSRLTHRRCSLRGRYVQPMSSVSLVSHTSKQSTSRRSSLRLSPRTVNSTFSNHTGLHEGWAVLVSCETIDWSSSSLRRVPSAVWPQSGYSVTCTCAAGRRGGSPSLGRLLPLETVMRRMRLEAAASSSSSRLSPRVTGSVSRRSSLFCRTSLRHMRAALRAAMAISDACIAPFSCSLQSFSIILVTSLSSSAFVFSNSGNILITKPYTYPGP